MEWPKMAQGKKMCSKPKNNDNKCFQYAASLALNFNNIDRNPQRISKIKPFINTYKWNELIYLQLKKIGINLKLIALNILYVPYNTKMAQGKKMCSKPKI